MSPRRENYGTVRQFRRHRPSAPRPWRGCTTAIPNGVGSRGKRSPPCSPFPPIRGSSLSPRKPKAVELGSPLARKVAEFIRAAGDTAPGRAELLEAVKSVSSDPRAVEKMVDGLARAGEIVRVKELLFDGAALRGIQEKLVAFLAKRGEMTVPEFKEMTGLSRKYIIPLLEHFDATKVTLRVGDKRALRKK